MWESIMFSMQYALPFAVFAGMLALIFELLTDRSAPIAAGLTALVLSVVANVFIVLVGQPGFTHWLLGGYALLFFVDATIALATSVLWHSRYRGAVTMDMSVGSAVGLWVITLVAWMLISAVSVAPHWPVDNANWDKVAAIFEVEEVTEEQILAGEYDHWLRGGENDLLRVPPETCNLEAKSALPEDIGTYLGVNNTFLQKIDGHWYCITDLKVTDWRGFRNYGGGVIPGYIVRDAMDTSADSEFRGGYQMRYVPTARWQEDLDFHVYSRFRLPQGRRVDALDNLEITDNWQPMYTGTVLRPEIGLTGWVADGIVIVDPETGEITWEEQEIPEWIDRHYSLAYIKGLADIWADHKYWDDTLFLTPNAGRRDVDQANDIITAADAGGKLLYQITFTSEGRDLSRIEVAYIDPETGKGIIVKSNGKTLAAVDNLVEEKTKTITTEGYNATECELQHRLLGQRVWHCILTGKGDSGSAGSLAGVAFVLDNNKSDLSDIVIGIGNRALQDAYRDLRTLLAGAGDDEPVLDQAVEMFQIDGIVERVGYQPADEGVGVYHLLILVDSISGPDGSLELEEETYFLFSIGADNPVAGLTRAGDHVTVTAYDVDDSAFNDIRSLVNHDLPTLEQNDQ